jgi:hypothetical protein
MVSSSTIAMVTWEPPRSREIAFMVYLEANLRKNPEGSAYSKFAEAR